MTKKPYYANPSIRESCPKCASEYFSQINSAGQKRCSDCNFLSENIETKIIK